MYVKVILAAGYMGMKPKCRHVLGACTKGIYLGCKKIGEQRLQRCRNTHD